MHMITVSFLVAATCLNAFAQVKDPLQPESLRGKVQRLAKCTESERLSSDAFKIIQGEKHTLESFNHLTTAMAYHILTDFTSGESDSLKECFNELVIYQKKRLQKLELFERNLRSGITLENSEIEKTGT
jgi:hypothetical protein